MAKKTWGQLSGDEKKKLVGDYKKMTGPKACDKNKVNYKASRNSLSRSHRKAEHGGAREGSGNKKASIAFCGECRQQVYPEDKCTCDNPPPVKVEA